MLGRIDENIKAIRDAVDYMQKQAAAQIR